MCAWVAIRNSSGRLVHAHCPSTAFDAVLGAGGALPPVVAYIGSMYHTACAANAHVRHMDLQSRQRWAKILYGLSKVPPKGTHPPQGPSAAAFKTMQQRSQVFLKELSDLLTKQGDPALSLQLLDRLEDYYGERGLGEEHELLRLPQSTLKVPDSVR
jgi:hypothetical protein